MASKAYRWVSVPRTIYREGECQVWPVDGVTKENPADIDDGRKQVRAKEVSSRTELRQSRNQSKCELERTVFELRAGYPVAYTAGNCSYQLLFKGVMSIRQPV